MNNYFKLNSKELEESLIPGTIASIKRSIDRARMDLEDKVADAESHLNSVSTITKLTNFDAKKWVEARNEALNKVKLAKAELANFIENFKETSENE